MGGRLVRRPQLARSIPRPVQHLQRVAGGVGEVVDTGETGSLHPVGDVVGMADAALEILGTAGKRDSMGAAARETAITRFGRDRVVSQYEELYESLSCPESTTR